MFVVAGAMSGDAEFSAESSGVQVVRLGEGARLYELDEAALRRLLLRPDVRDLPAVVLSVAGAYRGGKSFILDFFLRYLNAPRACQLSGEWLGKEDDQLKGFHWRGGGERDTTGMHLWSEPIITTMSNGEKVAVLLMDTQGTFDSESTIRQNSTIFALSTLISSVQIYNLSGNIREDDLQHLQLFTEYGKLACGESKAFQTLTFLVRDWQCPYEHAYGFDGGAELLIKRLQSTPNQKAELREVREHINCSFDQTNCFLMPHPGLKIFKKSYAGCIRDLTKEFRTYLLELVPSLFDPEHLTPKLINGDQVRTQDLVEYFQKYVDIFNSDELPEAVTIFKASADACLLAATRAARSLYAARMEARVRGARSLSGSALAAAHTTARADAVLCYTQKKKLGSQEDADARLEELIQELNGSLSQYILENEIKLQETLSVAKRTYDAAVSSVCEDHARLCLHPQEFEDLHAQASLVALTLFDAARDVPEDDKDDKRLDLEQSLEQKYEHLRVVNEQNNKRAVQEARDVYVTEMKCAMEQAGVSSDKLQAQHQAALGHAHASLAELRSRPTQHGGDPFEDQLLQDISSCFEEFDRTNNNNKKFAMQAAENKYNNNITSAWGPQMCCYHPQALVDLHMEAVEETLNECLFNRDEDNEYKEEVIKTLEKRLLELISVNEFNNERAVEQAVWFYTMKMAKMTPQPFGHLFAFVYEKKQHEKYKPEAVKVFYNRRRGATYPDDKYYDQLIKTLDEGF